MLGTADAYVVDVATISFQMQKYSLIILECNGFETIRAETGKKGIELALFHKPDVILLDIQLPDMPGTDVLPKLNASGHNRTSYAMAGDRQKLLAAGCDGYIEKPIDPMLFVDQVKKVLGVLE